ncbi:MAG: cytochrome b [Acetobacteraceae bacterium]
MVSQKSRDRYEAFLMGVHWLTLALLIAVYALIKLRGLAPKGTALHDGMKTWHFMLGLAVFVLVYVRLGLRAAFPPPPIVPELPRWQRSFALAMHVVLYAFLIVMPLLGWLTLSAKGKVIPFFGLDLPPLLGSDKALARNLQNIHETIGTLGYYLIGLHVIAALFHHYVARDNTLLRMLPGRGAAR